MICLEKSAQVVVKNGFHWFISTGTWKAQVFFSGHLCLQLKQFSPSLCLYHWWKPAIGNLKACKQGNNINSLLSRTYSVLYFSFLSFINYYANSRTSVVALQYQFYCNHKSQFSITYGRDFNNLPFCLVFLYNININSCIF